jgi:hypothetical protein
MSHPEFWISPKFGIFYTQKALAYDSFFSLLRNWKDWTNKFLSNWAH